MSDPEYGGNQARSGPPEGRYANGLQVGHNAFEFVLDFLQQYGDANGTQVHTRVVTSPAYAKVFLQTLTMSIEQYESEFGVIATAHIDVDEKH